MNPQNRPGPLNEHDYYSTRENTEFQSTINETYQPDEAHVDGLQVLFSLFHPECVRATYFKSVILNYFQVDNSSTVLNKIAKLYAEKLMNDVCLVVGGKDYLAHRLILCASSEVFHVTDLKS